MSRLLWLPQVLRAAGLTVREEPGWRDRGSSTFGPVVGIQCHETRGSRTSTDAGEIRVLVHGRPGLSGPIAQLYLSRTGAWHVIASGTAHHNKVGWAGPNRGYGNDALLGVEAQHALGEPWTDVQYRSYVRGVAALARRLGVPVARVSGHKEHQPGEKSDPSFDMDRFRRDVAAVLAGEQEDDMTPGERWILHVLNWRVEALRANRAKIRIPARPDLGPEYKAVEEPNLLAAALGVEVDVDEQAIIAGVLAGLDPEKIAAAIPAELAGQVADELAARLRD